MDCALPLVAPGMVRDLMVEAMEARFGDAPPDQHIEAHGQGRALHIARDRCSLARELGLEPLTTAIAARNRTAWRKPA